MDKLYYCMKCRRIIGSFDQCHYCRSHNVKELKKRAPVNVMGTKIKGKVFKITKDKIQILCIDGLKNKLIKELKAEELIKIL